MRVKKDPVVYPSENPVERWELHIGTVQIFIVGPMEDDWLACSKPNYQKRTPGTHHEHKLANLAVKILSLGESYLHGPDHIRKALALAKIELKNT